MLRHCCPGPSLVLRGFTLIEGWPFSLGRGRVTYSDETLLARKPRWKPSYLCPVAPHTTDEPHPRAFRFTCLNCSLPKLCESRTCNSAYKDGKCFKIVLWTNPIHCIRVLFPNHVIFVSCTIHS